MLKNDDDEKKFQQVFEKLNPEEKVIQHAYISMSISLTQLNVSEENVGQSRRPMLGGPMCPQNKKKSRK